MKLLAKTKLKIRSRVITAAITAAAITLGCILSGDNPIRFIIKLFTLEYLPMLDTGVNLVTIALFGFLASFHCIGMCGGIIISQCAGHEHKGIRQGLSYNIGRIISYTLIGLIIGAAGSLISLNGYLMSLVPLICALIMLVMALNLFGLFRWLRIGLNIEASPGFIKKPEGKGAFIAGFVTGFLPCGMLQMAQLQALGNGSAAGGAAIMFVFGVATSPVLFAFGTLAGSLAPKSRSAAMKAAAVIVIFMAVKMLMKSLKLTGVL